MGLGFVTGAKLGHRWGLPTTPQSHGHVSMLITWQNNVSVIVYIIKQIGVIIKLGLHYTERTLVRQLSKFISWYIRQEKNVYVLLDIPPKIY